MERTSECMIEEVNMAMGTQKPIVGSDASMGEDVEAFITDMMTQAHQAVASAKT